MTMTEMRAATRVTETRRDLPPDCPAEEIIAAVFDGETQLYACLDANRIRNLPVLLEASGLPHSCLFQGQIAEDAGDAAPWLVALPPDHRLTRSLVSSGGAKGANHPFAFLEAEAGIFLRSAMPMAELRRHLRRFLQVRSLDGRMFFFRFWEPAAALAYFTGLNDRPDLIRRWFLSREGHRLAHIVILRPGSTGPSVTRLQAEGLEAAGDQPGHFSLNEGDVHRLATLRLDEDTKSLAALLRETFPDRLADMDQGELTTFTAREMARMMGFGFRRKSGLFLLLAWELHYGPGFERLDPRGEVAALLADTRPEAERLDLLEARMTKLEADLAG